MNTGFGNIQKAVDALAPYITFTKRPTYTQIAAEIRKITGWEMHQNFAEIWAGIEKFIELQKNLPKPEENIPKYITKPYKIPREMQDAIERCKELHIHPSGRP